MTTTNSTGTSTYEMGTHFAISQQLSHLFLAKPKPLLRFARRTGPPLVLAAVGQAEPELPQTSAPTVIPEDEVFNSITKTEFFCQILFLSFD